MKMKQGIYIALFLVLCGCTLHPKYERETAYTQTNWKTPFVSSDAQIASFWTLFADPVIDNLIEQALAANQDLQVATARISEFAAKLKITRADFYPQIGAKSDGSRQLLSSNLPDGFSAGVFDSQSNDTTDASTNSSKPFNAFDLIFNGTYLLDIWGQIRSASEKSLAELLSQVYIQRGVILTLVTQVLSTYIQLRQYDLQLMISEETVKTREESYYLAQVRFELGLTSQMQVTQALAEVQDAKTRFDQMHISQQITEDLLCFLIGIAPQKLDRGKTLNELQLISLPPAIIPSDLLNQRPDILAKEQELIAANAQIGVARSRFLPQMSLIGSYGFESGVLSQLFYNSSNLWQYGLSLIQEIFTGGKLTGGVELAVATKNALLHSYQSTILQAFKEVNDSLISHQITRKLEEEQEKKVATLREYLHLARLRYDEGETDYLTFLDAERELFDAELFYATSIAETFTTLISIYQSVGGSWMDPIGDHLSDL